MPFLFFLSEIRSKAFINGKKQPKGADVSDFICIFAAYCRDFYYF